MANKLIKAEYIDYLAQNAQLALQTKRGAFYPNKDFGTYLIDHKDDEINDRLLAFARLAVDFLDGVYVKTIERVQNNLVATLIINNEERMVNLFNE